MSTNKTRDDYVRYFIAQISWWCYFEEMVHLLYRVRNHRLSNHHQVYGLLYICLPRRITTTASLWCDEWLGFKKRRFFHFTQSKHISDMKDRFSMIYSHFSLSHTFDLCPTYHIICLFVCLSDNFDFTCNFVILVAIVFAPNHNELATKWLTLFSYRQSES